MDASRVLSSRSASCSAVHRSPCSLCPSFLRARPPRSSFHRRRAAVSAAAAGNPSLAPAPSHHAQHASIAVPALAPAQARGIDVLLQLSAWNLLVSLLAAATTAVCGTITVFLVAMWPMLRATERASQATEAAMRAMEEASAATTKASVEMERLMLRTQAELPATLAAVEDAALQFDRLGLEIRDSGRRFGLTNPSASSGAFAARGGVGQFNADPLFTGEPEGGTTGPPDSVSAAVGRLVEEAQQAGAAALSGAAGGDQAAVLDASLKALGEWRGRLEQVLSATRDVAGAAGAAVGGAVEDAAAAVAFRRRQDVQALADASAPSTALAERQQGADGDGSDGGGGGAFGWLSGLRKLPGAVVTGAQVAAGASVAAGGAVVSVLGRIRLPGLPAGKPQGTTPTPPLLNADEDEKRAERAKAVALALALAEEAAEEARAASGALGRLFSKTAAALAPPPAPPLLPGGTEVPDAFVDIVDNAAALTAARAAEAAMEEASRASTVLLGALEQSWAAGDDIEPAVLAALEELPAKVFDDDAYQLEEAEGEEAEAEDEAGEA